jgi:hypothetical protein
VPSPYVSHDPSDGRPGWMWPVFIINRDGSWFGMSVCIELMTQMSSATEPTWGKSSLTWIPDAPWCLNSKGDLMSAPVLRSVLISFGIGLP